jgi:hypothetical protein
MSNCSLGKGGKVMKEIQTDVALVEFLTCLWPNPIYQYKIDKINPWLKITLGWHLLEQMSRMANEILYC